MVGLALLLRNLERAREEFLLFHAEELIVRQLVFAAAGTLQESKVKQDHVLFMRIRAIENRPKVIKRIAKKVLKRN